MANWITKNRDADSIWWIFSGLVRTSARGQECRCNGNGGNQVFSVHFHSPWLS